MIERLVEALKRLLKHLQLIIIGIFIKNTLIFNFKKFFTKVNEFFTNNPEAGAGEDPRKQSLDAISTNIFWIKNREQDLVNSFVDPIL